MVVGEAVVVAVGEMVASAVDVVVVVDTDQSQRKVSRWTVGTKGLKCWKSSGGSKVRAWVRVGKDDRNRCSRRYDSGNAEWDDKCARM